VIWCLRFGASLTPCLVPDTAGLGWEGFIDALKQNKRAIHAASGIDVTRREPRDDKIRPEFDTSIARLRPLLERIELTDRLIDHIVYRLYGLTEEEVAVVEGRSQYTSP